MKIINLKIEELKPYERNPRNNSGAVEALAQSIREFGFKNPIIIDKTRTIVCGHTRLEAAKHLKLQEIPCIMADDLSPSQIRAYRLADNRISELSGWDADILKEELAALEDLDFDMSLFGFLEDDIPDPEEDVEDPEESEPEKEARHYGDERERTFESMNLFEVDLKRCAGKYDMPVLKPEDHVPEDLISFNYVLNTDAFDKGVHFYIDDYQFERLWRQPYAYIERLSKFDCILTPDFSLYTEMPVAMQIWNIYRSRLIGQMLQDRGMKVIPTLSWCRAESFDFCFDGLGAGGTVSVSTIGVKKDDDAAALWVAGMDEAMWRLKPKHVLVYGGDIGYDFKGCSVSYIANHNAERFKNGR